MELLMKIFHQILRKMEAMMQTNYEIKFIEAAKKFIRKKPWRWWVPLILGYD